MVESKDYTIDDRKVGRPDLQKLQGALTDLPQIKDGIFTSAIQRKGYGIRVPAEVELEDGTHKAIKFLKLTEAGQALDLDAPEEE